MNGAASAAMYSNPYTAAIMGASQVLTSTLGGPEGPKAADSGRGFFDQHFDGSGWTVATGGDGSDARAVPTATSAIQQTAANALGLLNNPMVLVAGVMMAYLLAKR